MLQDLHWPSRDDRLGADLRQPSRSRHLQLHSRARFGTTKEDAMPVEKSAIGRTGEPVTMHVERGKIQGLARGELIADLAGCR
jgi:hypothetical protein